MPNTSASFGCASLNASRTSLGLSSVSRPVPASDLTRSKRPAVRAPCFGVGPWQATRGASALSLRLTNRVALDPSCPREYRHPGRAWQGLRFPRTGEAPSGWRSRTRLRRLLRTVVQVLPCTLPSLRRPRRQADLPACDEAGAGVPRQPRIMIKSRGFKWHRLEGNCSVLESAL